MLEAFPNPERKGCPDVQTIKALAEDRLPPGNAAGPHIGSCSECYAEYRNYRLDWKEARKEASAGEAGPSPNFKGDSVSAQTLVPRIPPVSISYAQTRKRSHGFVVAALVLALVGGGLFAFRELSPHGSGATSALVATGKSVEVRVDLSNAVTARGVDALTPVEEVTLPASVVRLSVTLPHFSQTGRYALLVSTDRIGKNVVAEGLGSAVQNGNDVDLQTTLDLRKAKPGAYFLATVRGSDNGTYYYPLKVK